jgi:hypothetical protein
MLVLIPGLNPELHNHNSCSSSMRGGLDRSDPIFGLTGCIPMDEVEVLRKALAQAVEDKNKYNLNLGPRTDEGYSKVFLQMVNLWERYPVLEDYIHNVRVAEIARRLTGSTSVRLWHDQALIKYPKDSRATAWHQDTVYWPMNEAGGLSCWMALDEVTVRARVPQARATSSRRSRQCFARHPCHRSSRVIPGCEAGGHRIETRQLHVSQWTNISLCGAKCDGYSQTCDGDNIHSGRCDVQKASAHRRRPQQPAAG